MRIGGIQKDISKIRDQESFTIRANGSIQIHYEAAITSGEDNLMTDQDIVLKDGWYPVVDGFCTYEVHASLPAGFIAISEGETAETIQKGGKSLFSSRFDRPYSDAITLVASKRYIVARDTLGGIDLYTYLLKEDAAQATPLIEGAKQYLTLYQSLLGKYPYRRFSIVESAMPSAFFHADLRSLVQKLRPTEKGRGHPLGHEIVHQWFGNSVFADYEKGNWHEGLTIYFAITFPKRNGTKG